MEVMTPVVMESLLRYHSYRIGFLTEGSESCPGTMSGGEFDWGGRLRKSIRGARRFPQDGRKPSEECKGIREPDCESDGSSRYESRT